MGQFFLGESQSHVYPHMRAKFGRGPTAVSKIVSFKFISIYNRRVTLRRPRFRQNYSQLTPGSQ